MRIKKGELILSDEDIDRLVIHKLKQIEDVFENHYEEIAIRFQLNFVIVEFQY